MSGCKKETNEETPFDYASLYRTEKTEAYKEEARATSRARYGYTKSSVQGYNDWYYLYGNKNTYSEMSFDSSSVHSVHRVFDRLDIPYISDIKLNFLRHFGHFCLEFVTHIVLFLFVSGKDSNFSDVRFQKAI